MKGTRPIIRLERVGMAALAAGLLLAGGGLGWADDDSRWERREGRREQRQEQRDERHPEWRRYGRDGHREVTVIRELPRGYRKVRHGHDDYYVHEHRYYRRHRDGFILVRPPVGALFATLPVGNVRLTIGSNVFFVCDDVYYRPSRTGYVVVDAPLVPNGMFTVVVGSPLLNVRTGPGLGFPVLCQVPAGTLLHVGGDAPGWYYVSVPGGPHGWVMRQFTRTPAVG